MKVGDVTVCKRDFGQFAKTEQIFKIKHLYPTSAVLVDITIDRDDKKSFTILNSYFSEYFMSPGEFRDYRINQIFE
jgi:hypothetical protein